MMATIDFYYTLTSYLSLPSFESHTGINSYSTRSIFARLFLHTVHLMRAKTGGQLLYSTAPPMDTCQENSRKYLQQAIDAEIKSLEASIQSLKYRRNALAPISSLPTEVISTIFFILRAPVAPSPLTPPTPSENPDNLPWIRLSHVCHHWREITLDQPLFWSHLHFNNFSSAGAAEILARTTMARVPLHLKAKILGHWNNAQFDTFQKQIRLHASHISHLDISADFSRFSNVIEGLVSSAPILEYLSLACTGLSSGVCIPDTLFDGNTPRLSYLKLRKCNISWKSLLLKGLKCLEIHYPSASGRPSVSVWLDALDEMPQLQILSLHAASPIAVPAPLPPGIRRTITLPSLSVLDLSASARDCLLALAHLILPALTRLCLTARSALQDGSDVQEILPHVSQHIREFQDTHIMILCTEGIRTYMLAWADVSLPKQIAIPDGMTSAPLGFSFTSHDWSPETHTAVVDAAMATLPLENLLLLVTQHCTIHFEKQDWLHHAQRWPRLQSVCLSPSAARGFMEMLREDNGGCENPLLPSLTLLVLDDVKLSARRTLRLRDLLMMRVEQGVPLEALDLEACFATDYAVRLLSEIVVDVLGPSEILMQRAQTISVWDVEARGAFVRDTDSNSGTEDYPEDDPWADTGSGDDEDEDEDDIW